MNNIATIDKIRAAVRALRNAIEVKGQDDKEYNLALGISFSPAKKLAADAVVKAVEENKKVSEHLVYGLQAGLVKEPIRGITKSAALEALNAFEQELSTLPQEAGAAMLLEFTVSNHHEQEIIEDAQKAINALVEPSSKDVQAVKAAG